MKVVLQSCKILAVKNLFLTLIYYKGSFTNDVISLGEEGGFQMMTADDGGREGV